MSDRSVILAIECSQRSGEVALCVGDRIEVERLDPEQPQDVDFMPAIDRLVQRMGVTPGDLCVVMISIGPGGFTGLRISVAAAKMLGEVLGARLVPVPTAAVVAVAGHMDRDRSGAQRTGDGPEASKARDTDHDPSSHVMPAQAGIQRSRRSASCQLDSRLRGNDARLISNQKPYDVLVALSAKHEAAWVTRLTIRSAGGDAAGGNAAGSEAVDWSIIGTPGLADAATLDLEGVDAVYADHHFPAAMRAACAARGVQIIEPRFSALACLAAGRVLLSGGLSGGMSGGQYVDPADLLPLYPREPEAVRIWRDRQGQ